VTDLVTGRFMNGLTQYAVQRGNLINTVVIDIVGPNGVPAPPNLDIFHDDDKNQIISWLNDGTVQPTPGPNETSRLYVIVLPNSTQLSAGFDATGLPITDVGGWHKHATYGTGSRYDNLFWCVVRTQPSNLIRGQEAAYVNSFAPLMGHELCEACSDRDGQGYINDSNGCEIGDICEANTSFSYAGRTAPAVWTLEPYWSQWDNSCIRGDQPVSLRRFLAAIGYTSGSTGLRGLGAPAISLDYIAQRMR